MKEEYKNDFYKDLTIEEKLGILHYERGCIGLVGIGPYDSLSANPQPTPKPEWVYISNVLGFDFEKFYRSEKTAEKCQKYKKQIKKITGDTSWHIGDVMGMYMFDTLHPKRNVKINLELMEKIDKELRRIYSEYIKLDKEVTYEEVPNMKFKGKPVYMRIE